MQGEGFVNIGPEMCDRDTSTAMEPVIVACEWNILWIEIILSHFFQFWYLWHNSFFKTFIECFRPELSSTPWWTSSHEICQLVMIWYGMGGFSYNTVILSNCFNFKY